MLRRTKLQPAEFRLRASGDAPRHPWPANFLTAGGTLWVWILVAILVAMHPSGWAQEGSSLEARYSAAQSAFLQEDFEQVVKVVESLPIEEGREPPTSVQVRMGLWYALSLDRLQRVREALRELDRLKAAVSASPEGGERSRLWSELLFWEGEVSRRTVFVRNNGFLKDVPSFTVLFSRCVHLGCPVQPRGLIFEERKKELTSGKQQVTLRLTLATGFGCPCHGAAYDSEGNRTAGPPVRALDRLEFSIRDGKLWVGKHFSVSHVVGTGANARIKRYGLATPGVHVDGISAWLYPIEVPR